MAEEGNISSEIFNESGILNETDIYNGWVNGNDEIYWTILLTSALIAIVGIGWLASSFGAMCSIIQDLFCGLVCAGACEQICGESWRHVDYGTETAIFFSYWTCLPWFQITYCIFAIIDGIVGIAAVLTDHIPTLKAAMVISLISLVLGILLLLIFSCISCVYSCCRHCADSILEEKRENHPQPGDPLNGNSEDKIEHNYFCNFFSHFAVPMIILFVLLGSQLGAGWSIAF